MKTLYRFDQLPGSSPLHTSLAHDPAEAGRWVSVTGGTPESLIAAANGFTSQEFQIPATLRRLVLEQNGGAGSTEAGRRHLARIREGRFVVVGGITGGASLGGPLRILFKALSTVRISAHLEALGIPAVPLMCIDEAAGMDSSCVLDLQNIPRMLPDWKKNRIEASDGAAPWQGLDDALEWMRRQLPATAFMESILADLAGACAEGGMGSGLAGLLSRWLSDYGLLVLTLPSGSSQPFLAEIQDRLLRVAAGAQAEASRIRDDLERQGRADAGALSAVDAILKDPHATARQLLPLAVLPWFARICWPKEVPLHACLRPFLQAGIFRDPFLLPSASFTLVEPRVGKVLEKYELELEDFLLGEPPVLEMCQARLERLKLDRHFEVAEARIGELLESLAVALDGRDPSIKKAVDGMREKVLYQLLHLKSRQEQSWRRQQDIARQQVEKTLHYLLPLGLRQEEIMNVNYFLVRHGRELIHTVYRQLEPFSHGHRLFPYPS